MLARLEVVDWGLVGLVGLDRGCFVVGLLVGLLELVLRRFLGGLSSFVGATVLLLTLWNTNFFKKRSKK